MPIFSQINFALSKASDWLYILKKKEKRKEDKKNQPKPKTNFMQNSLVLEQMI